MTRMVAIPVDQAFHCPKRPVTPWSNCHMAFSKKPLNMVDELIVPEHRPRSVELITDRL